jgi:2'-5' RNA ligase
MRGAPGCARLFLALWPEPEVRAALQEWRDGWRWPRAATPVAADKLHVTLHFLGNVTRERLPELAAGFAVPFTPFELAFGVPKLWPHGIAVLEPHTEPAPLLLLHAALAATLAGLGLQPEQRTYRPHVTLARRAAGAVVPSSGPPIRWDVRGYALVESRPGNGGAYTVLQHYR